MKLKMNRGSISNAIKVINEGGIVVFPTDTVYGIGCNPYDQDAVKRIYEIKNRSSQKNLPVLVSSINVASQIADFDNRSKKIAEKFWPGPLTLILQVKDKRIKKSMQLNEKIAIRIPKNDWLLDLLSECKALVGSSANISGQKSFVDPKMCPEELGYDLFIDGGIINSIGESTIVEVDEEKITIHREGVLSRQEILRLV